MATPPPKEFGKRKPAKPVAAQAAAPVKRSGHVALLLMGTFAVGGGAYALMPRDNCEPKLPGMAPPSSPRTAAECPPRGSSSGRHGGSGSSWSRRSSFFGGDSSSSASSSGTASEAGVTRGGFGSFARAFAGHFSGG
jgi:hypothetical protein